MDWIENTNSDNADKRETNINATFPFIGMPVSHKIHIFNGTKLGKLLSQAVFRKVFCA